MKNFFYNCIIILLLIQETQGSSVNSCELEQSEYLQIGCTNKCAKTYIQAIQKTAQELKYNIKFVEFNQDNINYNRLLSQVDGIISPGGHDIEPKYYTQLLNKNDKNKVELEFKKYGKTNYKGKKRDKFEYELFKEYIKNDKYKNLPLVGICYGMQMLAAVEEIPLYVDIQTDIGITARRKINDTIFLKNDSRLTRYIKDNKITGYKNHHQAINLQFFKDFQKKGLFTNVTISGISNDGKIAEILELKNRPAIGLQFHPERSSLETRDAVFKYFLINACNRKKLNNITESKLKTSISNVKEDDTKSKEITETKEKSKPSILELLEENKKSKETLKIQKNSTQNKNSEDKYYIQVASYKEKPSQRLIKVIENNHFNYIIRKSSDGIQRLLIGPFDNKNIAKESLGVVKSKIINQAYITK